MNYTSIQFRVKPSMRDKVRHPEDQSLFEWDDFSLSTSRECAEREVARLNRKSVWLEYRAEPARNGRISLSNF